MLPPIITWGEVLWDRYPALHPSLGPTGGVLGGAPANVAWHLAMLGAPVALASRIGDDHDGREAVRLLAARGVDTSLIQVDPERATGEVEIKVTMGEPRYRLVPDRAWERIEVTAAARAALANAPAMVFGTLSQRAPDGLAAWRDAVAACGPATLKVLDPNLRPAAPGPVDIAALTEAMQIADVVRLGESELALAERRLERRGLLEWLLGARTPRARLVAVTRGPRGSTLHTAPERVEVPAIDKTPGGDNVGCGDAYLAVLVHGLIRGWSLGDIGSVASRWAAAVASVRGATPDFDADTIARLTADRVGAP
jgi:fructokinase